jgi:agmatinase
MMEPETIPENFLGLQGELAELDSAGFVVLPVCYDDTASFLKGTAEAPAAIIAASTQLEFFDEVLLDEFHRCGIHTAQAVSLNEMTPEQVQQEIYETAKKFIQAGKIILALGGEHSITIALVRAAAEKFPGVSVLQIDAHADLRDEYEGSRFSHACVMRRIYDMKIPAVGVGIRSFNKVQHQFMIEKKLKVFGPGAVAGNKEWISDVLAGLTENVYLSLDIDGLDPAFAPGTGTPEPGGLTYEQVTELILAVGRCKKIIGADIVEVIPGVAGVATEYLAARLAYKIIAAAQLKK